MRPSRERALPTLNQDGSRRWLDVRLSPGRWWRRRRPLAWVLIAVYALLPWVKIGGHPALLCDVLHRRLHAFGATFQPTETLPLMLLFLSVFIAIFLITAVLGRAWCGWACPQTVYLEFVFRPIERYLGPKPHRRGWSRVARRAALFSAYTAVALVLANTFLAYFFGSSTLVEWVQRSPLEHPTPFLVMAATTALILFDFAYFREQMCTVVCPYARLQSALLDRDSLIVAYDEARGEPRGKLDRARGDCVDCRACVATCPTGIDIRQGLQLECIACAQCVDACDVIMARIGKPPRLIRYAPQATPALGDRAPRLLRPRVIVYASILTALVVALASVLSLRRELDVWILRGIGAPFALGSDGRVSNQLRLRLQNRVDRERRVSIGLAAKQGDLELIAPENPMTLPAAAQANTSVFVTAPASSFRGGKRSLVLRLTPDGEAEVTEVEYVLLGPDPGEAR